MKSIASVLLVFFAVSADAQTPFMTMDSINANNINALTLVHGDMWWNPATAKAHCKFPKDAQKNVGFAASLWMSGYDDAGQLHVAAQTYRQDGNDYWPGPLDGSGNLDYTTSEKWAKIWKVTREQVNAYRAAAFHTVADVPEPILTWPGKNNVYAKGKDGVPLVITTDMAPFVDQDGDGNYEPLKGDYPDFHGEQALWWVFSDNGPTHAQSDGMPLKVEVHVMAYAYKRGTLIDNVVYYEYDVLNKSLNNYHDFRLALWEDVDLGYYLDDFICFDSARRMGITYNAVNNDGGSAGNPPNSYGLNPPAVGVTMVSLPGDSDTNYVAPGSFTCYNNDFSIIGNPSVDTQFDHYMRSRIRNGNHIQMAGQDINYMFNGDPSDTAVWSECATNNNPGDRRFILASADLILNVGQSARLLMALVVSDSAGGCPSVDLTRLKEVADTAWRVYYNPLPPIFVPEVESAENNVRVYPNPSRNEMYVDCGAMTNAGIELSIYNVVGQKVLSASAKAGGVHTLSVVALPAGVYYLRYSDDGVVGKVMFVKE